MVPEYFPNERIALVPKLPESKTETLRTITARAKNVSNVNGTNVLRTKNTAQPPPTAKIRFHRSPLVHKRLNR